MTLTIDTALYRLIHHKSYLDAFVRGDRKACALSDDTWSALQTIDREQLLKTHHKVRHEVMHRKQRGCGNLHSLFPATIAAWTSETDLTAAFLESQEFAAHSAVPAAGSGCSIEEAFYRFAERHQLGDRAAREREFLTAIARALTMSPNPAFRVPPEFAHRRGSWIAVSKRSDPVIYAATPRGLAIGPAKSPGL